MKKNHTSALEKPLFTIALCFLVVGLDMVLNLGSGGLLIGLFFAYIVYRKFYKSTFIYSATLASDNSDFIALRPGQEFYSSEPDTFARDIGFGLATGINDGSIGSIVGSSLHHGHGHSDF